MQYIQIILLTFIVFTFSTGCIKKIDVKTRNEKPILVVEGAITTDTVPYQVKLSYSGPFTSGNKIPDVLLEKDANVSITDDVGNTTSLVYKDEGIYESTDNSYTGKVGRSYSMVAVLKDGRKYVSVPEKINPPVPINNISILFNSYPPTPSSLGVYADLNDPAGEENYYKWSFYTYVPRKTNGIPCGIGCIKYEYCFQKVIDQEFRILSDAAINGNKIKNLLMGSSPIYWYGRHYIDIMQHSISREDYQFSLRFREQQTRTGSILDPLPASIKGNIYNAADPNDFALGYFSASSVTHVRAVLVPFSITPFLLAVTAVPYIPEGFKNCFEYFPNALFYPPAPATQNPPPPGWENAQVIEVRWE
jgi:hypothetical protein